MRQRSLHHASHFHNQKTVFRRWLFVLMTLLFSRAAHADNFIQIPGVIHVHSSFSSGSHSLDRLVSMAADAGIEVLIPTDHDLVAMEYGVFPFRNIIKKRVEKKSVIRMGPEDYLAAINQINHEQKNVLVIPGVQSSPFYYWTGSIFQRNLTAQDYRKELLLIGLTNPEDYLNLPLLHRGFSTDYVSSHLPRFILFAASLVLGVYLCFQKGRFRLFGIGICCLSILLLINHHPFQSSRFDPYHGNQGIAPYQDLIDYVRDRNGLVFWAHPESAYAKQGTKIGAITLQTTPYPDALLESNSYTGFSGLYGDWTTAEAPGKQWDRVLLDYCMGRRADPVWIIAESDFHKDPRDGGLIDIDEFQNVFLASKRDQNEILDSLASGKLYAVRKGNKGRLLLDQFQIGSKGSNIQANMGEKLINPTKPEIHITVTASDGNRYPIEIALIKGGNILTAVKGETPYQLSMEDDKDWTGITYYRLTVSSPQMGVVLSNPIFVSEGAGNPSKPKTERGDRLPS